MHCTDMELILDDINENPEVQVFGILTMCTDWLLRSGQLVLNLSCVYGMLAEALFRPFSRFESLLNSSPLGCLSHRCNR
jgi:hypothetical protein